MIEIVLASANLHKLREFREMFRPLSHLEVLTLHHFPAYTAPEETGHTFRENAILKAEHAARHLGRWVLADDSGLVVSALSGKPGVLSRRYAGPDATDVENCRELLHAMSDWKTREERAACYECCLALANPTGLQKHASGICEGYLATEPRGRHGFGYDPLFIKNDYEKTFAELDDTIKNRISHRRKAFERLAVFLESVQ